MPERERRRRGHRDQLAPAAVDVVEVERGRADLHPHLARSGLGTLDGPHRQDLARRTVAGHLQGLHAPPLAA